MRKMILILVGIVLTIGVLGGVAFAQEQENRDFVNNKGQHCFENEEMIEIMRENGFEDMAIYMESEDIAGMREFMKNISDEDYAKIQELMKENGYGSRRMGFGKTSGMFNRMMKGRGLGSGLGNRCRQ